MFRNNKSKASNTESVVPEKILRGSRLPVTKSISFKNIKKEWVLIDASGVVLGRLASYVAKVLKGKDKPFYTPHIDCGDNVIIVNTDKICMTGNKLNTRNYYRHSGYPGGLKITTARDMMTKDSCEVVRLAVSGMLGRGPMARHRARNMRIYKDSSYEQLAQSPRVIDFVAMNSKNCKS